MGNRVKKAVIATGFGLGMLLATATPALADPWDDEISVKECWWGGGDVVVSGWGTHTCWGGVFDDLEVTHWS
ncbi:hypothetical protein MOQ72_15980 [Saccharopolyspora sp. K220]|uniref:hypothetical protein n=1 Tax=Saccharopolyspora soli TaxID=2926618 RepID=UPI001F584E88|nr:hypothetical protein [Saccharopolyspora soli]MCI2418943.1 hypothetical protein [Saccharopolyspora soli]